MRKYVLVSFGETPIQVAVPYVTDSHLDTLMHILTKISERTLQEEELVDRIHEHQHLVSPIDLSMFTHFIQEA